MVFASHQHEAATGGGGVAYLFSREGLAPSQADDFVMVFSIL